MGDAARKLETFPPTWQDVGTVVTADGAGLRVTCEGATYEARRAVGCLVDPEVGDLVLFAATARDGCFVLSVLKREQGAAVRLVAEGDLDISVPHGKYRVAAQDGIALVSATTTSVTSGRLDLNVVDASVVLQRLSMLGSAVRAELGKIKLTAGTLDSVMDRVSQRVKRSFRTVEETDQVRAGRIDYDAKEVMSLRGESTLITADELIKVDADQIHLG